jgi:hypothetical protein
MQPYLPIRIANKMKARTFRSPLAYLPMTVVVVKQQLWGVSKLSARLGGRRRHQLQDTVLTLG